MNKSRFLTKLCNNPSLITQYPDLSENMLMSLVQYDPMNLRYIKNPSNELKYAAIKGDGNAIMFVEEPSEALQLLAVNHKISTFMYLKNPTYKVQKTVTEKGYYNKETINKFCEERQAYIIGREARLILYIDKPSERCQRIAMKHFVIVDELSLFSRMKINNISRPIIIEFKDDIIAMILALFHDDIIYRDRIHDERVRGIINHIRDLNINWPELIALHQYTSR